MMKTKRTILLAACLSSATQIYADVSEHLTAGLTLSQNETPKLGDGHINISVNSQRDKNQTGPTFCSNAWNNEDALVIPAIDFGDGKRYSITLSPNPNFNANDQPWYQGKLIPVTDPGCSPNASFNPQTKVLTVRAIQDLEWDGPANAVMDATFQYDPAPSINGSFDVALRDYQMQNVKVYLNALIGQGFSDVAVKFHNIGGSPLAANADLLITRDDKTAYVVAKLAQLSAAFQVVLSWKDTQSGQMQSYKTSVIHYLAEKDLELNPLTTLVSAWLERHPSATLSEAESHIRTFIGVDEGTNLSYLGNDLNGSVFSLAGFWQQANRNGGIDAFIAKLLDEESRGLRHAFPFDPKISANIIHESLALVSQVLSAIINQVLSVSYAADPPPKPASDMVIKSGQELSKILIKAFFNKDGFLKGGIPASYADLTLLGIELGAKILGLDEYLPKDKSYELLKAIDAKLDAMQKDVTDAKLLSQEIVKDVNFSHYETLAREHGAVFKDFDLAGQQLVRIMALRSKLAEDKEKVKVELSELITEFNRLMEKKAISGTRNYDYITDRLNLGFLDGASRGLITLYNRFIYVDALNKGYYNIKDEARLRNFYDYWQARQVMALMYTRAYHEAKGATEIKLNKITDAFNSVWAAAEKLMPKDRLSEACPIPKDTETSEPLGGCFLDLRNITNDRPLMWWPQALIDPRFDKHPFRDVTNYQAANFPFVASSGVSVETWSWYSRATASFIMDDCAQAISQTKGVAAKFHTWAVPMKVEWENMLRGKNKDGRLFLAERSGGILESGKYNAMWLNLGALFLTAKDGSDSNRRYSDGTFVSRARAEVPSGPIIFDITDGGFFTRSYPTPMIDINASVYDLISLKDYSTDVPETYKGYLSSCAMINRETPYYDPCRSYVTTVPLAFIPVRQVAFDEQYYIKGEGN